ncbi:MAG: hypothetical protein ACKVP7_25875 [Hyphomicrobiaceae bacterium]
MSKQPQASSLAAIQSDMPVSTGDGAELIQAFVDQLAYNASFFQQLREREARELLPPEAEHALASELERLDDRLCQLARELAVVELADADVLRAKALAILNVGDPTSEDLTIVLARSLARTAIAFFDNRPEKSA